MTEQLKDWQIDYLCATRIMGYYSTGSYGYAAWSVPTGPNRGIVIFADEWKPSARIGDAWRVLGKFMEETHEIDIIRTNQGWYCSIGHFQELKHIGLADTATRAICIACLKAVGVPTESEPIATQSE